MDFQATTPMVPISCCHLNNTPAIKISFVLVNLVHENISGMFTCHCFHWTLFQDPRVLDAMLPYQVNYYGNPHSRTHAYGWESESAMEKARKVSLYVFIRGARTKSCIYEHWSIIFWLSQNPLFIVTQMLIFSSASSRTYWCRPEGDCVHQWCDWVQQYVNQSKYVITVRQD